MKALARTAITTALLGLGGCASHQRVPPPGDPPPVGHAIVHVYRPSYLLWSLQLPVYDGETHVGSLGARRSLRWSRPAGELHLSTFRADIGKPSVLTMTTEAGAEYHVRLQPALGIVFGGGTFRLVEPEQGTKGARKAPLARYRPPE